MKRETRTGGRSWESPFAALLDELAEKITVRVVRELRARPIIQTRRLRVKQAAVVLGRTENAIRLLISRSVLKNSSPDGRVQIDSKDIDTLITNTNR